MRGMPMRTYLVTALAGVRVSNLMYGQSRVALPERIENLNEK